MDTFGIPRFGAMAFVCPAVVMTDEVLDAEFETERCVEPFWTKTIVQYSRVRV